ncbi:MAG: hypothetical protein JWR52_1343 [Marmoricola sp.]|nr:hypothetical protein [Marmoricola sp.]
MTTLDRPVSALSLVDVGRLLIAPVVAGVALGVGDLVVMTHVAYPWANLANSSAVWAIGAFLLGAVMRTDPLRSAVAGVVMMVVAVEAYYGYAAFLNLAGVATVWSAHARMWMVAGVLAGIVFGIAGSWTSGYVWWQRVVGSAAGAGVLIGEALLIWRHVDQAYGTFHVQIAQTAGFMTVLGIAVLIGTSRRLSVLVPAAVTAVPASLICAAAFSAVGIAY